MKDIYTFEYYCDKFGSRLMAQVAYIKGDMDSTEAREWDIKFNTEAWMEFGFRYLGR